MDTVEKILFTMINISYYVFSAVMLSGFIVVLVSVL